MPPPLQPTDLTSVLTDHPDSVDAALEIISGGDLRLDAIRALASDHTKSLPELLIELLDAQGLTLGFVLALSKGGIALGPTPRIDSPTLLAPVPGVPDGLPIEEDTLDPEIMSGFCQRAKSWCCLIRATSSEGSGLLISPRLVLTANHVVANSDGSVGRIEVRAADGLKYEARCLITWPPNPTERTATSLPDDISMDQRDLALLHLDTPIGDRYGYAPLPNPPVLSTPQRQELMMMFHFPNGEHSGIAVGRVHIRDALRLAHNVNTAPGSSGGAAFNREFHFLGLHQGRWPPYGRLVPYTSYASCTEFREYLERDRLPSPLWSLDGTLDSNLVIGRSGLFDAIQAMLHADPPNLRGVWVRRSGSTEGATGLGFTYDLLRRYLALTKGLHRTLQVAPNLADTDLIADLAEEAKLSLPEECPGVSAGETTLEARHSDRASQFIKQLAERAREAGETVWLYFENPPSGLQTIAQFQLEAVAEQVLRHSNLRLILSGFETYRPGITVYANIVQARQGRLSGVITEALTGFRRSDIQDTLNRALYALGRTLHPDVVTFIVNDALDGLTAISGLYAAADLSVAASQLQRELKRRL